MKIVFAILFIIGINTFVCFGQQPQPNNRINLPDFQNPQAASLGKFGIYPTAEYTGALPIDIPLFEVDAKGYKIPFSLSFHGSGVKLDQMETEVGLGWSLSGIGMISRSVVGVPDEKPNGSCNIILKTGQEIFNNAVLPPTASQSEIMSKRVWLKAMSEGKGEDTHTDYYFYNFPNHSGKFIINNKTEYLPIPFSPIKIERGNISNDLYSSFPFKITDEQGSILSFNSTTYSTPENFEPLQNNAVTSSWYLDNILIPDHNESISFIYEDFFIKEYTSYQEQSIGYNGNADGTISPIQPLISSISGSIMQRMKLIKEISYGNGAIKFNYMDSPNANVSTMKFLKEILIYDKSNILIKKIGFDYSVPANRVKLSQVNLIDLQNASNSGSYKIIYNSLNFPSRFNSGSPSDYWGYYNEKGSGMIARKDILRSNISLSADGESSWVDYAISVGNSDRTVNENVNQAEMISKLIYPTGGYTNFIFEPNKFLNREIVTSDVNIQYGGSVNGKGTNTKSEQVYLFSLDSTNILKKFSPRPKIDITFGPPTPINGAFQTYTQFVALKDLTTNTIIFTKYHDSDPSLPLSFSEELDLIPEHQYELRLTVYGVSTYVNGNMTSSINAYVKWISNKNEYGYNTRLAGGLRTKRVENYDFNANLINSEEYAYGKDENGTGRPLFDPDIFFKNYQDFQYYTFYQAPTTPGFASQPRSLKFWERKYFGVTEYSSIGLNGSPVFYDFVTKYTKSNNSVEKFKAIKEYKLNSEKTYESIEFMNSKNYGAFSYLLNMPVPISEKLFDSKNQLINTKVWNYDFFKYNTYTPALVFENNVFQDPPSGLSGGYIFDYNIVSDFRITGSSIRNALQLPIYESESTYFYSNGALLDSSIVKKNMNYLSSYTLAPSEIKILQSDQKESVTKIKYPDDITSTTLAGGNLSALELQSIQKLNKANQHQIGVPIQTEYYSNSNLLSIERNLYADYGGKSRLNKNLKKFLPSEFSENIQFLKYDAYGNPQEIKKKLEPNTTYLWGYGGQYPIAEIKNATYAEVLAILGQATIDNLNALTVSETTINTAMNTLRTHANLSKAIVTSYTYKPLVGMKSKTDPRGVTEYYEYDGMQRLQAVLDQFKNATSSMDYHYRPN
ncbi:hypothetical protein LZQ00_13390 [Sphingobacterium sp. SRCM116780]|uniref:hypothetical protein n=1 Tax=Sphingobacterium sp. SRCM116780 TaxID=2907623 RepID=UPI001F3B1FFE|nr:hypothetical protein [Sphingobacterium sp. SRCM116780]UIR55261.1 hypothetical protein LZQ00_13390 [Sphingobacterium sp. SRCM116780]